MCDEMMISAISKSAYFIGIIIIFSFRISTQTTQRHAETTVASSTSATLRGSWPWSRTAQWLQEETTMSQIASLVKQQLGFISQKTF